MATFFRAALLPWLLLLLWVSIVEPFPVGKDKGRSLPLVISQYSNVGIANRYSKKEPATPAAIPSTTAVPEVKEVERPHPQVAPEPVEEAERAEPTQDKVEPEAAVPTAQVSTDDASNDHQGQGASDGKVPLVSASAEPEESVKSDDEHAAPAALETPQKNDDVQMAVETQDEEKPSDVAPSTDEEENTTDAAAAASPSEDETTPRGSIEADVTDVEAPAAPVQEPTVEEMKSETGTVDTAAKNHNAVVEEGQAAADDSGKSTESDDPIVEQSPVAASAAVDEETPMIHQEPQAALPSLRPEELFEEDRSFKNSPEEFNPAAVERIKALKETSHKIDDDDDEEDLTANEESNENESIRLERDDRKGEEKKEKLKSKDKKKEKEEKEKEKDKEREKDKDAEKEKELLLLTSKPVKETKPHKKPIIDDPVKEYDDSTRKRRSPQDAAPEEAAKGTLVENSEAETVSDDKLTAEEGPAPQTFSLVPDNTPVVLPDGESALSDKLASDETAVRRQDPESDSQGAHDEEQAVAQVFSLVPDNYPVVLPNGESTLSDKINTFKA